jgi:hypothetical protein
MTDRLQQLEQQAAAITAEIAKLKAERPPPPVKDEGVRILQLLDERRDLPSLREMERLFTVVKPHSPWPQALNDRFDEPAVQSFQLGVSMAAKRGADRAAQRARSFVILGRYVSALVTSKKFRRLRFGRERARARRACLRRYCLHAGGSYSRLDMGIWSDRIRRQACER